MEVTSAEEYRGKRRKLVKLPSGDVFRIKKPGAKTIAKLLDLLDIKIMAGMKPEDVEAAINQALGGIDLKAKLEEFISILIPDCVDEPRIMLTGNEPGALNINDIDREDAFALIDEIMDYAGLSKEAVEKRQSFRQEHDR